MAAAVCGDLLNNNHHTRGRGGGSDYRPVNQSTNRPIRNGCLDGLLVPKSCNYRIPVGLGRLLHNHNRKLQAWSQLPQGPQTQTWHGFDRRKSPTIRQRSTLTCSCFFR
ncbi:uncharacterized protein LOC120428252 [Culex pipiens pallens]|uniref:uncharacterized protein LOC120428252 n=1 Tax=Culex pipiens pallens TaxID=42434 RepID=UPI00195368E5|nr:uncharacterized protein LOC120428252 [Culex pipiens pallens]